MASTDNDTALLLDSEELNLTERITLADETEEEDDAALLDVSTPCSVSRRRRYLGSELVVAVFVVAFDTKRGEGEGFNRVTLKSMVDLLYFFNCVRQGNVVEWQFPVEVDLDGVEFRAIASGFHKVDSDFM